MILLLLIHVINIYTMRIQELEYYIYPTEGEVYQNYLNTILNFDEFMCKIYPQIPNVQLMNQYEEIYRTKGKEFKSMSSNNTHFSTLSYENEVIMYQWSNQIIEQVGESVPIDSSFNCFSINLSENFSILVDCYQNNKLLLIQLINEQSIPAYNISSSMPNSTKIQSLINGTNTFIVYAQYFEDYSILSLISSSFQNQSSIFNSFIDFDITITISPNIYAITTQEIFQLSISSDSQFYQKSNFTQENMSNFISINAYYDFLSYSQCDQIYLQLIKQENSLIQYRSAWFLGCEGQINFENDICPFSYCKSIHKIFQNSQFQIYLWINKIYIIPKLAGQQIYWFFEINQNNNLFYFNNDTVKRKFFFDYILNRNQQIRQIKILMNKFIEKDLLIITIKAKFNFDDFFFDSNAILLIFLLELQEIVVYKISIPSIQINLTVSEPQKKYNNFTLRCLDQFDPVQLSLINIYFQILQINDTNIYVMSNYGTRDYEVYNNKNKKISFQDYSGQLLNYKITQNEQYFNMTQITFSNVGKLNQNYQLVQFVSIDFVVLSQYLIGYNNQSVDILLCNYTEQTQSYQLSEICSINISVNAGSLQVAYSFSPQMMMIIGLSANKTIYLFNYYNDNKSIISYSNYTFKDKFSDFLVTYNNILLLILNKTIEIMTFNFKTIFTLKQSSINKLFKNIQFNPIQIVVNTQSQSSILYINNINEVIIISINQNSLPIPISLIKVNFTIKQINLVYQQLILSYLCNNDQKLCFQVYNVQNLPKYYYVKNLYSLDVDNKVIIQSDNLFLYVTFSNNTVYVYNPSLPYHQSLYYKQKIDQLIQFTEQFYLGQQSSIIISNNNMYLLQSNQNFILELQYQGQPLSNSINYPQFVYNITITSPLNETAKQQTPNKSLILYSNYTIFLNQRNLQINLSLDNIIPDSKNFSYPMQLILDRQVGYCQLTNLNQTNDLNKYCTLTQLFEYNSTNIPNYSNFSIITSINNECFALQNNSYIQTVNSSLTDVSNFSYSNLNFTQCLNSASNDQTLYSICENSTSQYLLNFTLNCEGNIILKEIIQLPNMIQNISKINTVLNQLFILGTVNNSQFLYWFNQSNQNFQMISDAKSQCLDFSTAQIDTTISAIKQQQSQIIIFYIEKQYNHQLLLYQFMLVQSNNELRKGHTGLTSSCNQSSNNNCTQLNSAQVLIMKTSFNLAIILLSNFGIYQISEIITFRLAEIESQFTVSKTIPNYGNQNNIGNSFYQNGVLTQQFQYNNINIVGFYYLDNLQDGNVMEPILIQGSFKTTISNYAMIVNSQYRNGTALFIYNDSIYNYPIGTWNVTCLLDKKTSNLINVCIFCKNEFSSGTYNITFKPPPFKKSSKSWIYTLISIIGLLLLYFYIKVKQRIKELEYISSGIEL